MLNFNPVTVDSLEDIRYYFQFQDYRTCDFTIGGMFMWAFFFKYEYAIFQETLFIKGVSEIDPTETAFSVPIGKLHFHESLAVLKEYCIRNNINLVLSAVPENVKDKIISIYPFVSYKLTNWADYLYDSQSLAFLSGRLYNKKRNHINKFKQMYPDGIIYDKITDTNLQEIQAFFRLFHSQNEKDNPIFQNEAVMTEYVLSNYKRFNFIGLSMKEKNRVIGFIIGEILSDTVYIHIVKADKSYAGVYETLNKKFIIDIINEYPEIKFVNMEEDVGDEGLRQFKLSYHPIAILNKYNLIYGD